MTADNALVRTSPESEGISSAAILALVEDAEARIDAVHSFMLLRHGRVVAEGWWAPYGAAYRHRLFSLSKAFTSTAGGMAIEEGLLGIDDPILGFFPDDAPPEPSDNLKALRVRQLLSMLEYLQPRLFGPLGIVGPTWQSDPQGINTGGFGLSVRTEDIARLGQLYLQKGMWRGQRLLSEAWVEEATSRQVSTGSDPDSDWEQGYGYKFWRCRYGLYRGDGAFGQFCIVMPEQDAVLAITSGVQDMGLVMKVAWEHLLPALEAAPLPENDEARARLEEKLASLALEPQPVKATSPLAARVSGARYAFAVEAGDEGERKREAEAVSFDFGERESVVTLVDDRGEQPITCRFTDAGVLCEFEHNVGWGDTKPPPLVGRVE